MEFKIPGSLVREHKNLHAGLHKVIRSGGDTGRAAEDILEVFHEHLEKEEKYVLPPLSLLSLLSQGKIPAYMAGVFPITEKLKEVMPTMLEEHRRIVIGLNNLIDVAKRDNKKEHIEFAEALIEHAKAEEEILYPAAILVGEYLKAKVGLHMPIS